MLLDLLEDAVSRSGDLLFIGDSGEREQVSVSRLWTQCELISAWLNGNVGRSGRVAAVLTASPAAVGTLLAALRSGITLGSLPLPARGMSPDEYKVQIEDLCRRLSCDLLLVDAAYLPLIPELSIRVASFEECAAGAVGRADISSPGQFVQFTSGSTGNPKGIVLSMDALGASVSSTLDVIQPSSHYRTFSWLPLSHDMGLVGMLLTPLCAAAFPWKAHNMTIGLMKPESFLRHPEWWIETISDLGINVTTVPTFALELACRTAHRLTSPDLSSLRVCVTGAERVRAEVLARFEATFSEAALDPRALAPAYGLAEASLAVTMVRPHERWMSRTVDLESLAEMKWIERPPGPGAIELVGCGQPLKRTQVRIDGPVLGEIQIRGDTMMSGYMGMAPHSSPDAWISTRDVGALVDDQLFVVGRTDDMFAVSGQNFFAHELEAVAAAAHSVVRPGAVGIVESEGAYVVVAEASSRPGDDEMREAAQSIRISLVRGFGRGPRSVIFVARGQLPKTPSGKIRRLQLQATLDALDVIGRIDLKA